MLGSLVDQALPVDEVSRPTDEDCTTAGHEKRKDYAAMTLKEKNGFASARLVSVFDTGASSSDNSVPMFRCHKRKSQGRKKKVFLQPCPSCRSLRENLNCGLESCVLPILTPFRSVATVHLTITWFGSKLS